jgi:hypothetical protein
MPRSCSRHLAHRRAAGRSRVRTCLEFAREGRLLFRLEMRSTSVAALRHGLLAHSRMFAKALDEALRCRTYCYRLCSSFALSASIRLDASALVKDWLNSPASASCSVNVFKYDACAPVIGSSPETQSSGSFSVFDPGEGAILGLSTVILVNWRLLVCSRDNAAGAALFHPGARDRNCRAAADVAAIRWGNCRRTHSGRMTRKAD